MARPIENTHYTDSEGVLQLRRRCDIEGCKRIRQVFPVKEKPKQGYRWENKVCCAHRQDGKKYDACSYVRNRERNWRSQGIFLTFTEYEGILKDQNYVCALCHKPAEKEDRSLSVDHDHKTGRIRGVVCRACNSALGWIERETSINKIMEYLGVTNADIQDLEYEDVLP